MSDPKRHPISRCITRSLLALTGSLAVTAAFAQEGASPTTAEPQRPRSGAGVASGAVTSAASASMAAEIQHINERMTLLHAQLNELELKAKIAARRKEIDSAAGVAPASSFDSKAGIPSVLWVAGLKGRLEAVLLFPGGASQRVKAGDVIGDRRVHKLSLNEVVLTDLQGRREQKLTFGSAPHIRENAQIPSPPPPIGPTQSPVVGR